MTRITSRKQIITGDNRQLFRPEQLFQGASVALVSVFEGTSRSERLIRAGFALTGILRQEGETMLSSTKHAWQYEDLEGVVPHWRGEVEWRNEDGVMISLTGRAPDSVNLAALVGIDPADLPDIPEPILSFNTFSGLGLVAVHGQWERYATLQLAE